ncbi:MAG: DUF4347 domain-containing protein [Spirulina sp. SIO3F2]|nr:DUF4347 domain-containing protein [Spirulina sp. SIO3F2]
MLTTSHYLSTLTNPVTSPGAGMLVVIDPRVAALEQLITGVRRGAQVLVLNIEQTAIAQITRFLAHHPGFKSLHLIGHGQPGAMQMGASWLDQTELLRHERAVRSWSAFFEPSQFDLLIYGCQVAQGQHGRSFLKTLHRFTGANVAAASRAVGRTSTGQNWSLDQQMGQPDTPLALSITAQDQYSGTLATFNVSTTTDLINSIQAALTNSEADTINLAAGTTFDITSAFTTDVGVGSSFVTTAVAGPTGLPIIHDTFGITIQSDTSGTRATIQRNSSSNFRIFAVAENAILNLTDVIINNGNAADTTTTFGDDGGGLLNVGGTVTITNSEITNNSALDDGGGVLNVGTGSSIATMTISGSTISGNRSSFESGSTFNDGGGGIDNDGNLRSGGAGATLNISNSIISSNTATSGSGGGLRAWDGGNVTITNTQITGNVGGDNGSGTAYGGGLGVGSENGNTPTLTITGSTLTGNTDSTGAADDSSVTGNISTSDISTSGTFSGNTVGTSDALDQIIEGAGTFQVSFVNTSNVTTTVTDAAAGVDLGDFATNSSNAITVTVTNNGSSAITLLDNPPLSSDSRFTISTFTTTSLAAGGGSTTFTITPTTSTAGTLTSTIQFDTSDTTGTGGISADGIFNFDITADVVNDLAVSNASQGAFTLGNTSTDGRIQLTVQSSSQSQVEVLQVTTSSGDTSLFSILPNSFLPSGFAASDQTFLFDVSSLTAGSTVQFSVNGQAISTATTELSTGRFSLQFDLDNDGATDDLSVIVDQVATAIPTGAGGNQSSSTEVIDLSSVSGAQTATFTVYREANFANSVGLYRIDNINGTVNGVSPGDANYAQTAINNRVSGIELAIGNQQTGTATGSLDGGALYAPFIVVNSTISNFLSGSGGEAFFIYTAANSDNTDHIVLLGDNTFGFEDLLGGGDLDFNDVVFNVVIG